MQCPRFRLRSGTPDWEAISRTDVDLVSERGDAAAVLSALVDTLVFSKITAQELKRAGFDATENLARLLQLTAEYLLHVQEAALQEAETERSNRATERAERKRAQALLRLSEVKRDGLERTNDQLAGMLKALRREASGDFRDEFIIASPSWRDGRDALALKGERRSDGGLSQGFDAPLAVIAAFDAAPGADDTKRCADVCAAVARSVSARDAVFGPAPDEHEDALNALILGGVFQPAPAASGALTTRSTMAEGGLVKRDELGVFVDALRRSKNAAKAAITLWAPDTQSAATQQAVVEVHVAVVGARGLPFIADAGAVAVLSQAGVELASTRAAIGEHDNVVWTDNGGIVSLDAVSDGPGVDVTVWAGAVKLGVAHAPVARLLYDGVIRLRLRSDDDVVESAELPRASRMTVELRCRAAARLRLDAVALRLMVPPHLRGRAQSWVLRAAWREVGGRGYAWRATATQLKSSGDDAVIVADAPLPLGVPLLRSAALLDVELCTADDDRVVASVEVPAHKLRDALLGNEAPDERGTLMRFSSGGTVLEAQASCSPLLPSVYAELLRRESDQSPATARPAAEVRLVSLASTTGAQLDDLLCDATQPGQSRPRKAVSLGVSRSTRVRLCDDAESHRHFIVDADVPLALQLRRAGDQVQVGRGCVSAAALRGQPKLVEVSMPGMQPTALVALIRPLVRVELQVWQMHLPWASSKHGAGARYALRVAWGTARLAQTAWRADAVWHELFHLLIDAENDHLDADRTLLVQLLVEPAGKEAVVATLQVDRTNLQHPSRKSIWPFRDSQERIVGELSMSLASSAADASVSGQLEPYASLSSAAPQPRSNDADDAAAMRCVVADACFDDFAVENAEFRGPAALQLELEGTLLASCASASSDETPGAESHGAVRFGDAALRCELPAAARHREPLLLRLVDGAGRTFSGAVDLAEVLRGGRGRGAGEPRDLLFSLARDSADEGLASVALRCRLRVATRAQVTLCAVNLAAGGAEGSTAALCVDGEVVGETSPAPAGAWFERFDVAVPNPTATLGRVEARVNTAQGATYVAAVAESALHLVSRPGLFRVALRNADADAAPAGWIEVHVGLTDYDSDALPRGDATAPLYDALHALHACASRAPGALPPHVHDALLLLGGGY
ncbi:hypothetical protein M885DRAFT_620473 [Pelagophyceae sp. CCMP2097]|nr:hypothetical protein M885DRAFT_620473 [Pelagophyceae sp. CCMP2097]